MTRDNQNNDPPAYFSSEMAVTSCNVSNEFAGATRIINIPDDAIAQHMNNQNTMLSDSYFSSGQQSDMHRDDAVTGTQTLTHGREVNGSMFRPQIQNISAGLGANFPISRPIQNCTLLGTSNAIEHVPQFVLPYSDEYVVPIGDVTTGSGWPTYPQLDTSFGLLADQSFWNTCHDMPDAFSSFDRNAAEFSGLAQNEGSWSSLSNNQRLLAGSNGNTSFPYQNFQTQQVGSQHFIPMQNNMSSLFGGSGESFSRQQDQLGQPFLAHVSNVRQAVEGGMNLRGESLLASNLWRPQERGPLQHYRNLNNPYISTGQPFPAGVSNAYQINEGGSYLESGVPLASNIEWLQKRDPFQHCIDLNIPAFPTEQPFPANVSNLYQINNGGQLQRSQVTLANNLGRPQEREPLQHCTYLNSPPLFNGQSFSADVSNACQINEGGIYLRNEAPLASNPGPKKRETVQHFVDPTAPAFFTGQVTGAANELIRNQSFDDLTGNLHKTSSNQSSTAISANIESLVPPTFDISNSSTGSDVPIGKGSDVGHTSSARAVSSLKRNAAGPPLMNRPLVQRRKITHLPSSTLPPVSFINQNAPAVPFTRTSTLPVPSTGPLTWPRPSTRPVPSTVSFINQNAPAVPFTRTSTLPVPSTVPLTWPRPSTRPIPSARLQNRTHAPSTRPQSRTPVPSTRLPSRPPVPSTRPQSRTPVPSIRPQSRTPVPSTRPPIAYLKRKVNPSAKRTAKIEVDCGLCHKDLSDKPDGSASHASVQHVTLPVAAVLPCGHAFHDHCLEVITPQEQSKDPPCIPCSLGESGV